MVGVSLSLLLLSGSLSSINWPSTEPHWPYYPQRKLQVLNGEWEFGFHTGVDVDSVVPTSKDWVNTTTQVPSVFDNTEPGDIGVQGTAIYRTKFAGFASGAEGLIWFGGCAWYCKVWIDGELVGEHTTGSYSPFWFNVKGNTSDSREIVVLANNEYDARRTPMNTGGDFYHYGGIHRSVIIHELPVSSQKSYLQRVQVTPKSLTGVVDLSLVLTNTSASLGAEANVTLVWENSTSTVVASQDDDDKLVYKVSSVKLPCESTKTCKPWALNKPNLYELEVKIASGDSIKVRFGLRLVGIKKVGQYRRITLNDEVVKFTGYNHHIQTYENGLAMNHSEFDLDLKLLLELGANVVRGGHYPQDQYWLDLLDENGIVMWEETEGPNAPADTVPQYYIDTLLDQATAMVSTSYNHPSVIVWAFFNEADDNVESSCPAYKAVADHLRSLDFTRLVTWASNRDAGGKCYQYADIIANNLYAGWYSQIGIDQVPSAQITEVQNLVDLGVKYDKPTWISETGAGSIYEWGTANSSSIKWGQKYQNAVVGAALNASIANDGLSAITLWHMFDFKANRKDQHGVCRKAPNVYPPQCAELKVTNYRPNGMNHKGCVSLFRQKKSLFDVLVKIFKTNPDHSG